MSFPTVAEALAALTALNEVREGVQKYGPTVISAVEEVIDVIHGKYPELRAAPKASEQVDIQNATDAEMKRRGLIP